jgi:hypothetical protein
MSTSELKKEIQDALNQVPKEVLSEVLSILKAAQRDSQSTLNLEKHLTKIMHEDKGLLSRFAQ